MKNLSLALLLSAPTVVSAHAGDIQARPGDVSLEGRVRAKGADFTIGGGVEVRLGMEQMRTEAGRDATRFRAGGVTFIRRFGDTPLGVGAGVRFLSGGVRADDLEISDAQFALVAPFAGFSFRRTRFGALTIDGLMGVCVTRLRDADRTDGYAAREDAARPVATLALRARF